MTPRLLLLAVLGAGLPGLDEPPPETALERIEAYIAALEKPRNSTDQEGLKVSASLLPDYLAYRIGKLYVAARRKGRSHEQAIEHAAEKLEEPKRFERRAGLKLKIENTDHGLEGGAAGEVRIFTIQEKFPTRVLQLVGHGRDGDRSGKRVKLSTAEKPRNLRLASVRISKFFKRRRGGRFDPILSKPIKVLVIEEEPVEVELLLSQSDLEQYGPFEFKLANLKKYEGPFRRDQIDLNDNRSWEEIEPIELRVELPARGTAIPDELEAIVESVETAAR